VARTAERTDYKNYRWYRARGQSQGSISSIKKGLRERVNFEGKSGADLPWSMRGETRARFKEMSRMRPDWGRWGGGLGKNVVAAANWRLGESRTQKRTNGGERSCQDDTMVTKKKTPAFDTWASDAGLICTHKKTGKKRKREKPATWGGLRVTCSSFGRSRGPHKRLRIVGVATGKRISMVKSQLHKNPAAATTNPAATIAPMTVVGENR